MIAVIVINYKNEERTIRFVRDETSKIVSPHCVIIVDNGATAKSTEKLKCLKNDFEHCEIIPSAENLGFAKGNNLGAESARKKYDPDILLFTNNDIRFIDSDAADRLASKLLSLPEAGMIGPRVVGLDGKLQSPDPFISFWDKHIWIYWSNLFYGKGHKIRHFRQDYSEKAAEGYHYKVMGSFLMAKADDFFACGMMDPLTFLFAEETILAERMKKIGKKVYYYPEVSVLHEHGNTTRKHFDELKIRQLKLESDSYYYHHYIGTPYWQIALAKMTYKLKAIFKR